MEIQIIEEKVKKLILEEIKSWAIEACGNPTDDNICKLFNVVEYLKKVLKKDNYSSQIPAQISAWNQSPSIPRDPLWGDNVVTAHIRKSSDGGDNIFMAQKDKSKTNSDDDNIFNKYL